MKQYNVAILGFGTVGSGVYRVLTENHDDLNHREVMDLHVTKILVRDFEHEPNLHLAPRELFTTEFEQILNDPEIGLIVECMGGVEPARTFLLRAMEAKKTVVTSNKEVISKHWHEFEACAKRNDVGLYYEATVGGGVPILRTVIDSMQANNIHRVMGIINGTTNYILTKMSEEGKEYAEVLKEAQELGYAEADPTADIEGYDAMYKLSILSSLAFHAHMPVSVIYREGITKLGKRDFDTAKLLGYEIKLLAIGKKHGTDIEVRVHPTMIPKNHPLASVRGVFNAIFMTGHAVDDIMLYGRGAGCMPTASAVVSDIIYACHSEGRHKHITFVNDAKMVDAIHLVEDFESAYCVRLLVDDTPGVVSKTAAAFAVQEVSLRNVLQLDAQNGESRITFLTHKSCEKRLQKALEILRTEPAVRCVESVVRVEE